MTKCNNTCAPETTYDKIWTARPAARASAGLKAPLVCIYTNYYYRLQHVYIYIYIYTHDNNNDDNNDNKTTNNDNNNKSNKTKVTIIDSGFNFINLAEV